MSDSTRDRLRAALEHTPAEPEKKPSAFYHAAWNALGTAMGIRNKATAEQLAAARLIAGAFADLADHATHSDLTSLRYWAHQIVEKLS
jgi:hypothetical protein